VNRVKADETTVSELMRLLPAREIVELILAIGFYMMMARLTETTRTDLDPPAGTKSTRLATPLMEARRVHRSLPSCPMLFMARD
jgi:hypothetical protein